MSELYGISVPNTLSQVMVFTANSRYMECTLVREQDLHQPDLDYVPDILKEGVVRFRHFPAGEDGTRRQDSGADEANSNAYGTFENK